MCRRLAGEARRQRQQSQTVVEPQVGSPWAPPLGGSTMCPAPLQHSAYAARSTPSLQYTLPVQLRRLPPHIARSPPFYTHTYITQTRMHTQYITYTHMPHVSHTHIHTFTSRVSHLSSPRTTRTILPRSSSRRPSTTPTSTRRAPSACRSCLRPAAGTTHGRPRSPSPPSCSPSSSCSPSQTQVSGGVQSAER